MRVGHQPHLFEVTIFLKTLFSKAKLFQEATKTRPHFSLPKVLNNTGPKLQWSTQKASSMS